MLRHHCGSQHDPKTSASCSWHMSRFVSHWLCHRRLSPRRGPSLSCSNFTTSNALQTCGDTLCPGNDESRPLGAGDPEACAPWFATSSILHDPGPSLRPSCCAQPSPFKRRTSSAKPTSSRSFRQNCMACDVGLGSPMLPAACKHAYTV